MGYDSSTFGCVNMCSLLIPAIMLLYLCTVAAAQPNVTASGDDQAEDMSIPEWVSSGGFLVLIVAVYGCLWGSALVCEDYFVPAMSKLCERFEVSDDMAGATLLAIGNSAPQLFISLVSVFVTESSLGLGTAIGTALFEQLFVCGACVLHVQEGTIALNWKTLCRDFVFYLLSLILLVWALEGSFVEAVLGLQDKNLKDGSVAVHLDGAIALVALYVIYVVVCAHFPSIAGLCIDGGNRRPRESSGSCCGQLVRQLYPAASSSTEWTVLGQEDDKASPLIPPHSLSSSTATGFDILSYTDDLETASLTSRLHATGRQSSVTDTAVGALPLRELHRIATADSGEDISEGNEDFVCTSDLTLDGSMGTDRMSADPLSSITTPHRAALSGQYKCWLLKKSSFYSRLGISSRKWQLRFFVLDDSGFRYMRYPSDQCRAKCINIFEAASVRLPSVMGNSARDEIPLLLFDVITLRKSYTLRALAPEVYRRLVSILRRRIAIYQSYPEALRHSMADLQGRICSGGGISETSRDGDRCKVDFVGDTTRSQDRSESLVGDRGSGSHSRDSDDEEFDDAVNVWDELAMYNDAAGLQPISTSAPARGTVQRSPQNLSTAIFRGIGMLSQVTAMIMRPLKWAIRHTVPAVLTDDVDEEIHPDFDIMIDEKENDNRPEKTISFRHRANKRLRCSSIYTSVSIRLVSTIFACLVWMGVMSYFLSLSCIHLGHMIGLTSAVTGLTVVSAGTSFSNLLTALIVSYQGQGSVAISNAFGSNIFCISIGLGVPWVLAIAEKGGEPFDSIRDDGIIASALLLIFILAGFLLALSLTNFVMYRWLAYVMLSLYIFIILYIVLFSSVNNLS